MPSRLSIFSLAAAVVCGWTPGFLPAGHGAALGEPEASEYIVQSWQTDEGLPGNEVQDVLQDQDGYIWLGSIGGLARFDGASFKPFSSPLIVRVPERNIRALAQTADGTVLMLPAAGGVVQLKDGRFSPHPIGYGLGGSQLITVFVDRGGAVWVGMYGGRVRRWQDGKIFDLTRSSATSGRSVFTFAGGQEGEVWIAGGGYLGCYRDGNVTQVKEDLDPAASMVVASSRSGGIWMCENTRLVKIQSGEFTVVSTNVPWAAFGGVVRKMFEDSHNTLWIGTTAHGLFRLAGGKFASVETTQSTVTAITEDREGDIWVSTDGGGIDRLRPRLFRLYDKKSGLPEDASNAASVDQWGDVWLANRGGGVVRVRGGAVSVLQPHDGPLKLRAYSVCPDDEGYLWVSEDRLYRFPSANPDQVQVLSNGLAGNFTGIHVLFKSREGDIWIGADPHLLACFRGGRPENYVLQEKFPGQRPRSLAEDPSGRIWIGTEDRQLIQMADGKFTSFTRKDGLPDAPIRSLYADKDGAIWIGTVGGGMVLRRNGKFTLIAAADGLPDDNIAEVMEDDAGRMWCGSRSGIFQSAKRDLLDFADGKTGRVQGITLGKNEGITALSCYGTSQPMACKTPDGQLWFVTRQGVLALDSRAIKPNLFPPPIFIDEILANDRPLKITEPLEVPPRCDKIEFRFSALSFVAPGKVRLRYKLDGVDAGWVEIINQRSAVYSALPPGRYGLHVTACNNDGLWNETGTYLWFRVRPAWWQSWWFQSSLLILCITAAALGIRYWSQRSLKRQLEILERQQALEKERTRIARDLHDDLGATVTQVGLMLEELREASLSAEGVKHQSAAISGRVLNLARDLDAVVWSVNPRNDSLAELFAYLSQSFLECFQRTSIRPRLEVMEVVPDSSLAPEVRHHLFLIVKEAINNVIKHSQATQVTLSLGVVENALDIRMADNGQGFSTGAISQSKRHGLANMRARVQQLAGKLEISSHAGQGVSIHISIPSWQAMRVEQHHTE